MYKEAKTKHCTFVRLYRSSFSCIIGCRVESSRLGSWSWSWLVSRSLYIWQRAECSECVSYLWNVGLIFPVFYYVYSSNDRTPSHLHQNIFLVTGDLESPFRAGWNCTQKARRTYECEYFFLHDDDLYFNLNRHKSASTQLSSELLRVWTQALPASFDGLT